MKDYLTKRSAELFSQIASLKAALDQTLGAKMEVDRLLALPDAPVATPEADADVLPGEPV